MINPYAAGMGMMVPVIKSDIKIVRRTEGKSTATTHYNGFQSGLISSIENVLAGDRDIDHAVIEIYVDEEDWGGYDAWGMC